jgi:hypothetical protein
MSKFSGVCPLHKEYLNDDGNCEFCQHSGIKTIRATIRDVDKVVSTMIHDGYDFNPELSHAILIFNDKNYNKTTD